MTFYLPKFMIKMLLDSSILFLALFIFTAQFSNADCGSVFKDVQLTQKLGTTSIYSNLRGSENSIKTASSTLIKEAIDGAAQAQAPKDLCPSECQPKKEPIVLLVSAPNKILTDYSDKVTCQQLLTETKDKPIHYKDKKFPDLKALNSYYGDLCQGSGIDGKALYKICHSTCSLSYKSFITKNGEEYSLDVDAVCGDARDKDEGNYLITSFYRWGCQ